MVNHGYSHKSNLNTTLPQVTMNRRARWERVAEMPETIIVDDILEAP